MKKLTVLLPLVALLVFVSGCGKTTPPAEQTTVEPVVEENNPTILTTTVVEDEDGLPPLPKMNADGSIQIMDLASQYDQATIKTNKGDIVVKFYEAESPITVNNFLVLAERGFYDDVKFHRVLKDFMIQTGDPNSKDDNPADDGRGGPGYRFPDEFNSKKLVRGSLAMANSGPNTNGSQFFIVTTEATPWLDGRHTNFGYVVEGMDIVDAIESVKTNTAGYPAEPVVINSIELK